MNNALAQLNENIQIIKNDPVGKTHYQWMRNSEIQCFEYTIDTFWKLLKEYLLYAYKVSVEVPTPKKVFRVCLNVKFVTDQEFVDLLKAIDARNVTSHTYHEDLAEEISHQIPAFYELMHTIFKRISL